MIYFLDSDPGKAVDALARKHIGCMLNNACSVVSTVLYNKGYIVSSKPYNKNKELIKWASSTNTNLNWVIDYGIHLSNKYNVIFGKDRNIKINFHDYKGAPIINKIGLKDFPLLLPAQYKEKDIVNSYRNYYVDKIDMVDYKSQEVPPWFTEKYSCKNEVIFLGYFEELQTSLRLFKRGDTLSVEKLIDNTWTNFNIFTLEERLIIERILKK
jgi:hypothetical protein